MAFVTKVRFAGLCANVPTKSLDDEEHEKLWVVMPNVKEPNKDSICKHYPGIFVDASRLVDPDQPQVTAPGMSFGTFFWGIVRKEITLFPKGAGGAKVTELRIPKDVEDTDFRKVPNLGEILPAAAKINPNFKKDGEASFKTVIARVILRHGTLRALSVENNPPVFFPNGEAFATNSKARSFAHDTVLELGELESLEIQARDLDGGGTQKLLIARGTKPCDIVIGNLCADLWLKELGGIRPYPPPSNLPVDDLDFEALYNLSYPLPEKRPVPRSKGGAGGEGAKCHQGIFSPFIEA